MINSAEIPSSPARLHDRLPVALDHRVERHASPGVRLRVEEHLDVAHALRRGLRQVRVGKVAEVVGGHEHVHRRVVDGEEAGERVELVRRLHLGDGLLGELDAVARRRAAASARATSVPSRCRCSSHFGSPAMNVSRSVVVMPADRTRSASIGPSERRAPDRKEREAMAVAGTKDLTSLMVAIANLDQTGALELLDTTPSLATAGPARSDEFFLAERFAQVYEGDTALHAAGFSYDAEMARVLVTRGADVRARNRRGAEPLHAAVIGAPGSTTWNPARQRDVVLALLAAGADPNAAASGGVTPLHRAVRNRCSVAVDTLLPRRCRSAPAQRPWLDRVGPCSLDDRSRGNGFRCGQGRATNHRRAARDRRRTR